MEGRTKILLSLWRGMDLADHLGDVGNSFDYLVSVLGINISGWDASWDELGIPYLHDLEKDEIVRMWNE